MKRLVVAVALAVAAVVAVAGYFGTRPSTASSGAPGYVMVEAILEWFGRYLEPGAT